MYGYTGHSKGVFLFQFVLSHTVGRIALFFPGEERREGKSKNETKTNDRFKKVH